MTKGIANPTNIMPNSQMSISEELLSSSLLIDEVMLSGWFTQMI